MNTSRKLISQGGLVTALMLSLCSYSASTLAEAYKAPRNSHDQPDLQGLWDFRNLTPLERPKALGDKATFTPEELAAFKQQAIAANDTDAITDLPAEHDVEVPYNSFWLDYGTETGDLRTSLIVDPPNGRLPELTKEAVAALQKGTKNEYPVRDVVSIGLSAAGWRPPGPESLGLSERCLMGFNAGPPLVPSAYNNNLRIIQTPDHVALVTEMVHTARIIPLDGRPHLPKDMTEWSGDGRGHWEGDTLVVKTKNFTDKTPTFQLPLTLDNPSVAGAVGSAANMELEERFTRTGKSSLLYEYTLTDLSTFAKPFTVAIPLQIAEGLMFEYACHEGNYAMSGILKGARQVEKDEAVAQ